MSGNAFVCMPHGKKSGICVAVATQICPILSNLNLEKVMWQGGFWFETQCDQFRRSVLQQWAWVP